HDPKRMAGEAPLRPHGVEVAEEEHGCLSRARSSHLRPPVLGGRLAPSPGDPSVIADVRIPAEAVSEKLGEALPAGAAPVGIRGVGLRLDERLEVGEHVGEIVGKVGGGD
ncbi:MAG: hypothetical protein M3133_11095, partial [Actinomycetota bacterium]|nr:hypothetical protein [Actinomycetota bacterium]